MYDEEVNELDYMGLSEQEMDPDPMADDPMADDPMADDPMADEPELDEPELDEPEDLEGPDAGVLEGVETVIKAIKTGLQEMGMDAVAEKIQVELEADADAGLEEPDLGEPEEAPPEMELPGEEEEEVGEEPPALEEANIELEEDDDFVNEVVRRVTKRLVKAKK